MSKSPVSDEQLGAWLDGELSEAEAGAVERALATDPALVARLARLEEDMLRLTRAYSDPPLPDKVPFVSDQQRYGVIAASLLLGLALGAGIIQLQPATGPAPEQRMLQITEANTASLEKTERILLHIDSKDEQRISRVLGTAEQLLQERARKGKPVQVEVVANARGLVTLRRESPYANKIRQLRAHHSNVSFKACGMAMAHFELLEGEPVELVPEAQRVPAALGEILKRLQEGWTYVHG